MELHTRNLLLRPYVLSDSAIVAASIDYDLAKDVKLPWPYSENDAIEFINLTNSQEYKKDNWVFAIINKATNQFIGSCGLHDKKEEGYTLGIWLIKSAQNKTYGVEAMAVLAKWGFEELNIEKYNSRFFEYNERSKKLQLGAGSVIVRQKMEYVAATGKEEVCIITELTKETFYKNIDKYKRLLGI